MNRSKADSPRTRGLRRALGLALGLGLVLGACVGTPAPALPTPSILPMTTQVTDTPVFTPTVSAPSATPTALPEVPPTVPPYRSGFPDPAAYGWQPVVSGFRGAVDVQNAGDGSGRLFVIEKAGRIVVVRDGALLPDPFLAITGRVGSSGTEQGLLGLAFHPDYARNGFFYVNYTDVSGNTVIARFQVSADDPDRADPGSEKILLRVDQPFANHNGGGLAFGPDGYLYVGLGDGGSGGDPYGNGQNTGVLLGKMLRIDVDGGDPYAIPPDNPFAAGGGRPEIWGIGLRNPWRFSFDRLTGDLYIADVGQNNWEEVDHVPAVTRSSGPQGLLNFGWNALEATHPYEGPLPAGPLTGPVAEYSHSNGRCSVTGGYVYRGNGLPEWQGVYLFADYCTGEVIGLIRTAEDSWTIQPLFYTGANVTTFGQGEDGEIYLVDYGNGILLKLAASQ
jgi:glucose/arabinose dehydrogenase